MCIVPSQLRGIGECGSSELVSFTLQPDGCPLHICLSHAEKPQKNSQLLLIPVRMILNECITIMYYYRHYLAVSCLKSTSTETQHPEKQRNTAGPGNRPVLSLGINRRLLRIQTRTNVGLGIRSRKHNGRKGRKSHSAASLCCKASPSALMTYGTQEVFNGAVFSDALRAHRTCNT